MPSTFYNRAIHCTIPTLAIDRPSYFERLGHAPSVDGNSPIAPDGGFGPMHYSEDDDEDEDNESQEEEVVNKHKYEDNDQDDDETDEDGEEGDEGFGDDFDDFEEGAQADDFDDFDNDFQEPMEPEQEPSARQVVTSVTPPYVSSLIAQNKVDQDALQIQLCLVLPCCSQEFKWLADHFQAVLDFSTLDSLESIIEATSPHFATLFPQTTRLPADPPPPLTDPNSTFLTERSLSLWSQLVAPPPLQPPNWVRSRIRRLFLVSLGVPVDLDEILPKSKQKKLILPYTSPESQTTSKDPRKGSVARLKTDAGNASDSSPPTPTTANPHKSASRRRRGPPPPPEFDMGTVRLLCSTTNAALENMRDKELEEHIRTLDSLLERGKEVLQYWVRRKEAAVGEKEAFDGVIENLVRHARKVRK